MNYQNLMDAYLAEGKDIVGRIIKNGSVERKVQDLRGNTLNLSAVLDDGQVINYTHFQHYDCE
ncbi:MAG: hypothetical protein ACOC1P_02025 [Minisyncoccales bacterium]